MILFNLMSIQFMAGNDTINWNEKTITIRHNIKLIHITIHHYPEHIYTSLNTISKTKSIKNLDTFYTWKKVIEYWNKNILDYNKMFNINFDTFTLGVDYSLAPIYINNDIYIIGIFILNTSIIKTMKDKNTNIKSYSFLSRIEPYNYKKKINSNKYNFFYGIVSNKNDEHFKNKFFAIDTNINIPINYILQNSMNYLPKLDINRIKMSSQNLLDP
jgi:hypothetical protein